MLVGARVVIVTGRVIACEVFGVLSWSKGGDHNERSLIRRHRLLEQFLGQAKDDATNLGQGYQRLG